MAERDEPTKRVITGLLGRESVLLPFAEAVVRHLTRFQEDGREAIAVTEKVGRILSTARDPERSLPVEVLRDSPELLASFFQNADLLPARAPEAARVAHLVMITVESLDTRAG